ncbi:MAG: response regulator [Planctomycetota bacterium]|jgi:DNA-binding NarL/FixJ family response regulator
MSIRIVIADDYVMMRQALRRLLEYHSDLEVLGEAEDGERAVERCLEFRPDVALVDVHMPRLSGIEATRQIVCHRPQVRVLAVSSDPDHHSINTMLAAGASGYVLKDFVADELVDATRKVAGGGTYLSTAIRSQLIAALRHTIDPLNCNEEDLLRLLLENGHVDDVSSHLQLDPKTLLETQRNLMKKIAASDVADLIAHIVRNKTDHG